MIKDLPLLRSLYKRYAFLRCEDEKEQTLYYLQTLNAVDFSCFTNAYTNSFILYQVLIFPSQRSGASLSSASLWLHIVGTHTETDYLQVPRGVIHFSFWARNLGLITSLRLGHDNAGLTPHWLVEHVLVRSEFTGQTYRFHCGRWLGKGIDDGSIERYLVGSLVPGVPGAQETQELVKQCANPPPHPCPATSLRTAGAPVLEEQEVQTMLSEAINRIIKHHHKSLKERVSWAQLMCGEMGLVFSLIQVFSFGFKSARLFGKNLSVWDFFLDPLPEEALCVNCAKNHTAATNVHEVNNPDRDNLQSPWKGRQTPAVHLPGSPRQAPPENCGRPHQGRCCHPALRRAQLP